jgi:hypothetical protein
MSTKFKKFWNKTTNQYCCIPAGRYGNFLNSIKKLANYVRYNMPKYYVVHLVLTLKEAAKEVDTKDLHRVMQFIDTRLKRQGVDFKYIAVKEIQKERLQKYGEEAIHFHVLCIYSKPYVFPSAEAIAKSWKLGNVKITAPKLRLKMQKIAQYIGKYIGKGYEYEQLEVKKSFTASQVPQIYKLNEKRLSLIKAFYGGKADSFKCTYTKVWAELKVKRERVREYFKIIKTGLGELGQDDLFNKIRGMENQGYVQFKEKRTEFIEDVFVDKLMIKKFESDWVCVGLSDVPF